MAQYQFEPELHEGDELPTWVLRGRKFLNVVIREFNDWQVDGSPAGSHRDRILARIEWGKVQCDTQGGSEWIDVLNRMKEFVEQK